METQSKKDSVEKEERSVSHSRRKTPIVGNTMCRSESKDKQLWHRRLRRHAHAALVKVETENDGHMTVLENEVSKV